MEDLPADVGATTSADWSRSTASSRSRCQSSGTNATRRSGTPWTFLGSAWLRGPICSAARSAPAAGPHWDSTDWMTSVLGAERTLALPDMASAVIESRDWATAGRPASARARVRRDRASEISGVAEQIFADHVRRLAASGPAHSSTTCWRAVRPAHSTPPLASSLALPSPALAASLAAWSTTDPIHVAGRIDLSCAAGSMRCPFARDTVWRSLLAAAAYAASGSSLLFLTTVSLWQPQESAPFGSGWNLRCAVEWEAVF